MTAIIDLDAELVIGPIHGPAIEPDGLFIPLDDVEPPF